MTSGSAQHFSQGAPEPFSDMHIFVDDPGKSLLFPGPVMIPDSMLPLAVALAERAKSISKDDFMLSLDRMFFRGRRDNQAVDGTWLRLRHMVGIAPNLDALPSPMATPIRTHLVSDHLTQGGFVYIVGAPGSGKTTSGSATVVSRLSTFGGFAYTIEDPPEMPLSGWHGTAEKRGYCAQTWVAGDRLADWQEAFRGVLRSQPTNTPTILFVGEVRDRESASALIRAASSGFLVIATGFGTDIPSALDTLSRLAGTENDSRAIHSSLANVLRIVVHQRIVDGRLVPRVLMSANGRTSIAAKIRDGRFNTLEGDIQYQENQLMKGDDVFAAQLK